MVGIVQVPLQMVLFAQYGFKITDDGSLYTLSAGDLLDTQRLNNTDAAIKSAVEANLRAQH